MATLLAVLQSIYPVTPPYCFTNIHVGPGSYSKYDEGMGVGYEHPPLDSVSTLEVTWTMRYRLMIPMPAGTPKIVLVALSQENSKVAKVRVKWASVRMGEAPASATLNDEGVTTVTFGTADANKYIETKVVLDAGPIYDESMILVDLVFGGSGWTLTKCSTWLVPILIVE